MEISQEVLALLLLYSFFYGTAVGAFFDINRIIRVLFGVRYTQKAWRRLYDTPLPITKKKITPGTNPSRGRVIRQVVINLGDFSCLIFATVGLIILNYGYNSGRFRFFTVIGVLAGFFAYRYTVGKIVMLFAEPVAFLCKYCFLTILSIIDIPMGKIRVLLHKFYKKMRSLFVFAIERKRKKVYNIEDEVYPSENYPELSHNRDKSNGRFRVKIGSDKNGGGIADEQKRK